MTTEDASLELSNYESLNGKGKDLVFRSINYFVKTTSDEGVQESKQILKDVSGEVNFQKKQILEATNNFLANNKVLEAVRRADQMDFDDSTTNKEILMVPIVQIATEFAAIEKDLQDTLKMSRDVDIVALLSHSAQLLSQPAYETKAIKAIFNRYSDNIYLSSPDEANAYLLGGTLPSTRQTEQYLLRNDVLTAIQNVQGDLKGMIAGPPRSRTVTEGWEQVVDDALSDLHEGADSLERYLALADPVDVKLARQLAGEMLSATR